MTGQEDVLATCSLMREKFDQAESKGIDVQPYEIVPVYGSLPAEQQELIFKRCGQIVGRVWGGQSLGVYELGSNRD